MYEVQTFDNILDRLLDGVISTVDKSEGSITYDALAPVARELEQAYIELDEMLKRVFAKTSYEEFLDMRAAEFGVYRKTGTKGIGKVTFSGVDNAIIPVGTIVQTDNLLQYATVEVGNILNGTVTVGIQALYKGNLYNVPIGSINEIPIGIFGISGVTNGVGVTGGTEDEGDDSLLSRLLLKVQMPTTSGNSNHYKQWALEVDGVGDVVIMPLWNGAGTVKVILLDSNKRAPSQEIVDRVIAHIEQMRPIGATVTVVPASEVNVNVTGNFQVSSGIDNATLIGEIKKGLGDYLSGLAFKDGLVRYTRIENVLLDIPAIIDYSGLVINNATTNIQIPSGSVAVLGTVTINV